MSAEILIPYSQVFSNKELELKYLSEVLQSGQTSGNNNQSHKVEKILHQEFGYKNTLLVPSATHALEMMALLLDIKAEDEVIMPSYTFVSTANAFVLRGAKIVFVDIDETLNLCPKALSYAITEKTRACVVIHYGGNAAKIDEIKKICDNSDIVLLEDAAHCLGSKYKDIYLGNYGDFGCLSFHQTKNIQCGEGGALIVNSDKYLSRARVLQEKGTNRFDFKLGKINKYNWIDVGSSYLLGELPAAYLRSQLEEWGSVTELRRDLWQKYYQVVQEFVEAGYVKLPCQLEVSQHNGHIFCLVFEKEQMAKDFVGYMLSKKIQVTTHYEPLHLTPFAKNVSQVSGAMDKTEMVAKGLVRLPLYSGMGQCQDRVIQELSKFFMKQGLKG